MMSDWIKYITPNMTCHSLYATIAVVIALVPIESLRFAFDRRLYAVPSVPQASKPDGVDNCIRKMAAVTGNNKFSEAYQLSDRYPWFTSSCQP